MNKEQAFEILEKGLNIANTKGAFLLRDATVIQQALDILRADYIIESIESNEELEEVPKKATK